MFARFSACPDAELNVLPCELIADNGVRLREMVLDVAARMHRDANFVAWLLNHVAFSDTLVDRICTPSTTEALAAIVEPHTFWALKGPVGPSVDRLAAAAANGIVIAPTIENYQLRKVRLLNGLHTAMASIAPVKFGIHTVRESLESTELGTYLEALLFDELIPTIVPPVSIDEATAYANLTLRRMRNPFIEHQLSAINQGAATKWQTRLLPAIAIFEERNGCRPARIDECLALFQASQGS
jgi:tagaturonate reductase